MTALAKQHLIDPEICIRCGTCEDICPIDAVTHDDANYVVDMGKCDLCMSCIAPCPTGAIDNWRVVAEPYSLEEQFSWDELPDQEDVVATDSAADAPDDAITALLEEAHSGAGSRTVAPASAATPQVNLYSGREPVPATVQGTFRLTHDQAESDVRHIVLDFGKASFPYLEGQCLGIVPPGLDASGQPHRPRLYSISSPRTGERPNSNNLSLTVKREDDGICSNYLCDLQRGDQVQVTGPFGSTFLMPDDPEANMLMICTGTGAAPFRGFTERRRQALPDAKGRLMLFFGARHPKELPYFGPLKKVPPELLTQHLVYSRQENTPREYVQDRMRSRADEVADLMKQDKTHVYVCGLKAMEDGVEEVLSDICSRNGLDWSELKPQLCSTGRYHVETY